MSKYSVALLTPEGERVRFLDRLVRLEYINTVNGVGLAKIKLKSDFDLDQFVQEDTRIEIWRRVRGEAIQIDGDTIWLVRDWKNSLNRAGRSKDITAYSANDMLDRPIVNYYSGSAQSSKTSVPADDMMKAIVRENLGALATDSARDLSNYISVAPDLSTAPVTSKSFARRNVLSTLKALAQDSDENGVKLFFGLVYNPDTGLLNFETRTDQWGVDHSQNDDARVVLSVKSGTLSEISREYISSEERNVIVVAGQGEGIDRDVVTATDTERLAVSPLNRREYYVNASNVTKGDTTQLAAEGESAIKRF